jgi:hypothetical protein
MLLTDRRRLVLRARSLRLIEIAAAADHMTWYIRDTRDNRRYNVKLMTPDEKGVNRTGFAGGSNF